jgi:hypothetical protein
MSRAATKSDPQRTRTPVEGPPEEEFWEKYNRRLEFPLSTVTTVLLHVLIGTLIVLILLKMENNEDHASVPMKMMDVGGLDDFGDGSAGSGGREDPIIEKKLNEDPATAAIASLANPNDLPQIKEKTIKLIDPTGNLPITAANAAAYEGLEKAVREKLLGAQRGTGNVPGKGPDVTPGSGPGGTGANSTLGRNMRWTLRFKVSSGRDYLKQLETMGAKILVPMPGTEKCLLVENLSRLENRRVVSGNELGVYADLLKFADSRRDAVGGIAGALELDFTPKTFFAVFTKEFENELARKETNYANRRAEQIEETIFKVTVRGGEYTVVVDEQKLR